MLVHAAAAYVGQNPSSVHMDGPSGLVGCQSAVVITATVRGAETGALVSNQTVVWDIKASRSADDSEQPQFGDRPLTARRASPSPGR
jgi:hypothetical protein